MEESTVDYTYKINNTGYSPTVSNNITWGNTVTSIWPYTTYWSYGPVYMYQIFCPKPRCRGIFWAKLDEVTMCPKCTSRIKVSLEEEPDYTVVVNK